MNTNPNMIVEMFQASLSLNYVLVSSNPLTQPGKKKQRVLQSGTSEETKNI